MKCYPFQMDDCFARAPVFEGIHAVRRGSFSEADLGVSVGNPVLPGCLSLKE